MDTGKRLDNDGPSSEVSWLEGCMLTAASLPIVGVTHDHPQDALGLVVPRSAWNICILSCQLVANFVHGHIKGIGGTAKIQYRIRWEWHFHHFVWGKNLRYWHQKYTCRAMTRSSCVAQQNVFNAFNGAQMLTQNRWVRSLAVLFSAVVSTLAMYMTLYLGLSTQPIL